MVDLNAGVGNANGDTCEGTFEKRSQNIKDKSAKTPLAIHMRETRASCPRIVLVLCKAALQSPTNGIDFFSSQCEPKYTDAAVVANAPRTFANKTFEDLDTRFKMSADEASAEVIPWKKIRHYGCSEQHKNQVHTATTPAA